MSVNFTVGLLCYNNMEESLSCLGQLIDECVRLKRLLTSIQIDLVVTDNGVDGAGYCIGSMAERSRVFTSISVEDYPDNIGQGAGRNRIVERSYDSDLILFLDSDIRVVPDSLGYMIGHILSKPKLGCVTPHPARQTRSPEVATKRMKGIEFILNDCRTACTGYALYRTKVFLTPDTDRPIRFEERGPFAGPGWGLEDDDIYLQMTQAGWGVDYFVGIIYLQRKPRSSWKHIGATGINVIQRFEERKAFFLEKWKTKGIDPAILMTVKGQDLKDLRA